MNSPRKDNLIGAAGKLIKAAISARKSADDRAEIQRGVQEPKRERVGISPPSPPPRNALEFVKTVVEDIETVLEHDPAARHPLEVVLVYPGLHALWLHRISHAMWKRGQVTTPRLIAHANRLVTGIEIHPGAKIGRRVFIDHGMGIVIGETATVGDECLLFKGAVLGGTSLVRADRHPTLGKSVVVGTNACILGPIQVGDGAKVGSNSVVIRDVPQNSTVVGVPGRIVAGKNPAQEQLNHADLPDPVANLIQTLIDEIDQLKKKIEAVATAQQAAVSSAVSSGTPFSESSEAGAKAVAAPSSRASGGQKNARK